MTCSLIEIGRARAGVGGGILRWGRVGRAPEAEGPTNRTAAGADQSVKPRRRARGATAVPRRGRCRAHRWPEGRGRARAAVLVDREQPRRRRAHRDIDRPVAVGPEARAVHERCRSPLQRRIRRLIRVGCGSVRCRRFDVPQRSSVAQGIQGHRGSGDAGLSIGPAGGAVSPGKRSRDRKDLRAIRAGRRERADLSVASMHSYGRSARHPLTPTVAGRCQAHSGLASARGCGPTTNAPAWPC